MTAAKKLDDSAVDRSEVAVVLVGPDGVVSYANMAAHALLGYPLKGLEGLSLQWLSPPSRHAELRNVQAVLEGQNSRRIRSAALRADGSVVEVAMSVEPCMNADGQVVAASVRYDVLHSAQPTKSVAPSTTTRRPPSMRPSRPPPLRSDVAPRPSRARAAATHENKAPSGVSKSTRPEGPRARALPASPPPLPKAKSAPPKAAPSKAPESGVRRTARPADPVLEGVDTALQLLGWLEQRLLTPIASSPLDDPRERSRSLLVLGEARAALIEHVNALKQTRSD